MDSGESKDSGYRHPWNQPQTYEDEEEDENEYEPAEVQPLPPAPKSILRNNRTSSLREVTLVDESKTVPSQASKMEPSPVSILKRPGSTGAQHNNSDTQNEFISILKHKSGATSNLPPPPSTRTLTSINTIDMNTSAGQQISTIGVIGNSGRNVPAQSDDMDIDDDNGYEPEQEYVGADSGDNNWGNDNGQTWDKPLEEDSGQWSDNRPEYGHSEGYDRGQDYEGNQQDYSRNKSWQDRSDGDRQGGRGGYQGGQKWPSESPQRPWQPRPRFDRGETGFSPRQFTPRPRFQNYGGPRENFRGNFNNFNEGKRPFFSPRQRMPYNRY